MINDDVVNGYVNYIDAFDVHGKKAKIFLERSGFFCRLPKELCGTRCDEKWNRSSVNRVLFLPSQRFR